MILVPPELRRIEEIPLRQAMPCGDPCELLWRRHRRPCHRREIGEYAHAVRIDQVAVEAQQVLLADLGVDEDQRRVAADIGVEIFAPVELAECADFRKFRLQAVIEVIDAHHERRQPGERRAIGSKHQQKIDAGTTERSRRLAVGVKGIECDLGLWRGFHLEISFGRLQLRRRLMQCADWQAAIGEPAGDRERTEVVLRRSEIDEVFGETRHDLAQRIEQHDFVMEAAVDRVQRMGEHPHAHVVYASTTLRQCELCQCGEGQSMSDEGTPEHAVFP
jgi:hypothetical protein